MSAFGRTRSRCARDQSREAIRCEVGGRVGRIDQQTVSALRSRQPLQMGMANRDHSAASSAVSANAISAQHVGSTRLFLPREHGHPPSGLAAVIRISRSRSVTGAT